MQEEEEQKRQSMLGALAELAAEKEKLTALLAEEQVHFYTAQQRLGFWLLA